MIVLDGEPYVTYFQKPRCSQISVLRKYLKASKWRTEPFIMAKCAVLTRRRCGTIDCAWMVWIVKMLLGEG
jgi:hypothetical protein